MIKRVLEDIKIAYNNKAYFSALALTLTIPDICGKIQYKNDSNLKDKEEQIKKLSEEKNEAIRTQQFEQAAKLRDKEKALREELESAKKEWESNNNHFSFFFHSTTSRN